MLFNQTNQDKMRKFSKEFTSSKPHTMLMLKTKKQTNHLADAITEAQNWHQLSDLFVSLFLESF